jgi:ABC-type multidrug transport system permease subunit
MCQSRTGDAAWCSTVATATAAAAAAALAYFLASVSPGLMVAMPLLSFVLIVSLVCCGFMIRVAAMPAVWWVTFKWAK